MADVADETHGRFTRLIAVQLLDAVEHARHHGLRRVVFQILFEIQPIGVDRSIQQQQADGQRQGIRQRALSH